MIELNIPSFKKGKIEYVVFDYNGTLGLDGWVRQEIKDQMDKLRDFVKVYIVTADTYGNARQNLRDTSVNLHIISQEKGVFDKLEFINKLGPEKCIAVGNGNNDRLMLKAAFIGICIMGKEGCSTQALLNSDMVISSIEDALKLLINQGRLKATLRG